MRPLRLTARIALLTALSLILFLLEGFLPLPLPRTGAKHWVAAHLTPKALRNQPPTRDAAPHQLLRIFLSAFLGGGFAPLLYSMAGGLASFAAMALLLRHSQLSLVGISAVGGLLHNMAQLFVAAAVMESSALLLYAPLLGVVGILTGTGIGILAQSTMKKIKY